MSPSMSWMALFFQDQGLILQGLPRVAEEMLLTGEGSQAAPGERSPEARQDQVLWPQQRHSREKLRGSGAEGGKELACRRGKGQNTTLAESNPTWHLRFHFPHPAHWESISQRHEKQQHYLESSKHVAHHNWDHNQVSSGQRSSKSMALVCH